MDADSTLIKENARLRKELTGYQNAMEEMELRARRAEESAKGLARKLAKVCRAVTAAAQAAEAPDGEDSAPQT